MTSNSTRQRRQILTEEDYSDTLSSIVKRDYFPQIAHLERQNQLLEARASGNIAAAVAVRRDTRQRMQAEEQKAEQRERDDKDVIIEKTEGRIIKCDSNTAASTIGIRKRPRPLQEETLTGFHARVTNEDDQEFDVNQKQEVQANRQRLETLFKPEKEATKVQNNNLLEMASDDFAPESNRIAASAWKPPSMKNEFFFNPTPLRGASQPSEMEGTGTKLLTNGEAAEQSALMLPPSKSQTQGLLHSKTSSSSTNNQEISLLAVITSSSNTKQSTSSAINKSQLVEYIPKHTLEKKIEPSQTRFPSQKSIIPMPGQGAVVLHGKQYNDGLVDASDTDGSSLWTTDDDTSCYSTDLDAPLRPVDQERARRKRRIEKKQNRRSYVAMTPQIVPGAGNQSPITTWGTIEDTPLVLSGREQAAKNDHDNGTVASFKMASESQREQQARQAELELERRSKRAKQAFTKPRKKKKSTTSSLTPAAMSLMQKSQRLSSRSRDAFGSALRSSYTSSQQRSRPSSNKLSSQRRVNRDHAHNATPQI